MPQRYEYDGLGTNQLRLFYLVRGNDSNPLAGYIKLHDIVRRDEDSDRIIITDTAPDHNAEINPRTMLSHGPHPDYRALSYHWGDLEDPVEVDVQILSNSDRGRGALPVLQIKPNLARALRELQKLIQNSDEDMVLWIDQICIDQLNFHERNVQIQRMAYIYSRATLVYVWLGESYEESKSAFDFARNIPDNRKFNEVVKTAKKGVNSDIIAFYDLMHRPWFERRWIVQEICLAKEAMVLCGSDQIEWKYLEEAISLFSAHKADIQRIARQDKKQGNTHDFIGEHDAMGAVHLVEITNNIAHKADDGSVTEQRLSLEGLMSSMTMFQTSNPYDIVYALLWLASDYQDDGAFVNPDTMSAASSRRGSTTEQDQQHPPSQMTLNVPVTIRHSTHRRTPSSRSVGDAIDIDEQGGQQIETPHRDIEVDYNKTVFQIYVAFLRHVFKRTKSIDIICHPWAMKPTSTNPNRFPSAPEEKPSLPTWMLTIEANRIFEIKPDQQIYKRVSADPLVGKPGNAARVYAACAKRRATGEFSPEFNEESRSLNVYGFTLGTLHDVQAPASGGLIPEPWLEQLRWLDEPQKKKGVDYPRWVKSRKNSRPDWLWRLFVADRDMDGYSHPPTRWRSICTWVLDHRVYGEGIDTRPDEPYDTDDVAEFKQRARAVVWGRRLAKIKSIESGKYFFALVPSQAKDGDIVCILDGCSVPVLLHMKERAAQNPAHSSVVSATPDLNGIDEQQRIIEAQEFNFIGGTYVHGMMYGEGYKHRQDNGLKFRRFNLV